MAYTAKTYFTGTIFYLNFKFIRYREILCTFTLYVMFNTKICNYLDKLVVKLGGVII